MAIYNDAKPKAQIVQNVEEIKERKSYLGGLLTVTSLKKVNVISEDIYVDCGDIVPDKVYLIIDGTKHEVYPTKESKLKLKKVSER